MAGNSSSGILEAPLVGLPVLNIGDRQAGRIRTGLVLDSVSDPLSIKASLDQVFQLSHPSSWPRPLPASLPVSPTNQIMKWLHKSFQGDSWSTSG